MTDWTKAYQALAKAGYSDAEIAAISGVTRSTVCNVRNGTWPYKHDPGYEGGLAVLAELDKVAERERVANEERIVEIKGLLSDGDLEENPLEG